MSKLISDKPVIGNLEGRAAKIYEVVIKLIREEKDLRAFGVYGEWGSGKTSVCYNIYEHFRLAAIQSESIDDSYIVPVWFDAWRFQHEKALYPALLRTIGEALTGTIKSDLSKKWGKSLLESSFIISKSLLSGIKIKAFGAEFSPKETFDQFDKEQVKSEESNQHITTQLNKTYQSPYLEAFEILKHIVNDIRIDGKKIRIVLFIDDLDRCLPDIAFKIIEELKIWFDIDGYTICMALKEDEVVTVVSKHLKTHLDLEGVDEAKKMARDYLLKVLPLGIYIKDYGYVIKQDDDKFKIYQFLERDVNMEEPTEIFKQLKIKNEKDKTYSFRKLINVSNELYVENLIKQGDK